LVLTPVPLGLVVDEVPAELLLTLNDDLDGLSVEVLLALLPIEEEECEGVRSPPAPVGRE
jgi:hypothetical protein